ncbi:MAG: hypothetical protein HY904_13680 [Deltaproteobacteria bacterium]|nr:hypothetical protein [Deltaproteobacteria bacterium]
MLEGLALQPPGDPYRACRWLMAQMDQVFHGVGASVGFAVRHGEETTTRAPGRVFGWSPGLFVHGDEVAHRVEMTLDILRQRDFVEDDVTRDRMRAAGRVRVYVCRGYNQHSPLPDGLEGAILRRLRLADRMTVHIPLAPHVEGVLMVDRKRAPVFSPQDAWLAFTLQRYAVACLRSLARACGYLDAVAPLTPRERDVVRLLLTGQRERDVAHALGMTPSALHERVKEVYGKFQVTSRPELMALWLTGAAPRPPEVPPRRRGAGRKPAHGA